MHETQETMNRVAAENEERRKEQQTSWERDREHYEKHRVV